MATTATRWCAAALAALTLAGCRADLRAERREDRRDARESTPTTADAEIDALESELDEIDALLTEG